MGDQVVHMSIRDFFCSYTGEEVWLDNYSSSPKTQISRDLCFVMGWTLTGSLGGC